MFYTVVLVQELTNSLCMYILAYLIVSCLMMISASKKRNDNLKKTEISKSAKLFLNNVLSLEHFPIFGNSCQRYTLWALLHRASNHDVLPTFCFPTDLLPGRRDT